MKRSPLLLLLFLACNSATPPERYGFVHEVTARARHNNTDGSWRSNDQPESAQVDSEAYLKQFKLD